MSKSFSAPAALLLSFACGPTPPTIDMQRPVVTVDPPAALDSIPQVARLEVQSLTLPPAALALFSGELSDHYVGELRDGKVPASLREREVTGVAWFDAKANRTIFAPSRPLELGELYTLAVLGSRPLSTLSVDDEAGAPYAARVWPPREWPKGGGRWVFCGDFPDVPRGVAAQFDPGGIAALADPGADSKGTTGAGCLRVEPESSPAAGIVVPPPRLAGIALDPAPVDFAITSPAPNRPCAEDEVALGAACARVLDDRAVLGVSVDPVLLALDVAGSSILRAILPRAPVVVTGLIPGRRLSLRGTSTDLGGRETAFSVEVTTAGAMPHVVLNEVLANPIGSEPAQEWLEIVNDGAVAVDLTGFTLDLSDGVLELPRASLRPGAFALVVGEGYEFGDGRDVPPAPGTLILRVPRLGLSNSGEALSLRAPDQAVVSVFPPVPPPGAGVSVGRRAPSLPDTDPKSFGAHTARGASPGWENDIVTP
jgi:hypothetical protein